MIPKESKGLSWVDFAVVELIWRAASMTLYALAFLAESLPHACLGPERNPFQPDRRRGCKSEAHCRNHFRPVVLE